MKIALIGNPNCGKTTLFNVLTGMNQKVGNWTGVTIEKKTGICRKDKSIEVIDLPGIYSIDPFSLEETVTRNFLQNDKPDCVVNILDATNLERNLYLTTQLLELDVPVVVALNMMDQLTSDGVELDVKTLSERLGLLVVPVSARKKTGINELLAAVKSAAKPKKIPVKHSVALADGFAEHIVDERYTAIGAILDGTMKKGQNKAQALTDKIDRIVLNKWLAFPIFILMIWLMYFVSIQIVGGYTAELLESLIIDRFGGAVADGLSSVEVAPWLISLLVDGVVTGVGTVLTFIPQIVTLFLFITVFEACGYMSRVAYIMDRLFRGVGLSGKSFIPMIVGCGCSVPAIMTARTIDKQDERRLTIMLTPFIPCSAKLPVFGLFVGAFFPENPLVAPAMYLVGIGTVLICGLLLTKLKLIKNDNESFLLELPPYRMPKAKSMFIELWDKVKGFLIKAGTIIFIASVVMWALQSLSWSMQLTTPDKSILSSVGKFFAPLFIPLGWGNWQAVVATISGFAAKENVVASFSVLLKSEGAGLNAALATLFTPASALSFMVFILLSSPCVAALSATKKEFGSWKALFITVLFQTSVAYVVAAVFYGCGLLYETHIGVFWTVICCIILAIALLVAGLYVAKQKRKKKCVGCGGSCKICIDCNKNNKQKKNK